LFFFRGPEREYALASVAPYYLLLWVRSRAADDTPDLGARFQAVKQAVAGVREILARMGILESARAGSLTQARDEEPGEAPLPTPEAASAVPAADLDDEGEADEQVAALLETLGEWNPEQVDVDPDAFWQEAASSKGTDLLRIDADALSYEEARRLGLVPETQLLEE
jgi:hypothetical protein